ASARSTVSMARTTPAQKPRGEQSMTSRIGFLAGGAAEFGSLLFMLPFGSVGPRSGHGPGTLPCQGDRPISGIAQTRPYCLYNHRIPVIPDDNCFVSQGRAKPQG